MSISTYFRIVEVTLVVDITLINFHGAYIYQEETLTLLWKYQSCQFCAWKEEVPLLMNIFIFLETNHKSNRIFQNQRTTEVLFW